MKRCSKAFTLNEFWWRINFEWIKNTEEVYGQTCRRMSKAKYQDLRSLSKRGKKNTGCLQ